MKRLKHLLTSSLVIIILLSIAITTETANAQQVYKVFDEIGGGGGTSNSTEESGSGSTMYIVGGVLIAGVLLYALFREKKEPEKKDTISVLNNQELLVQSLTIEQKIAVDQSQMPINVFIGVQRDKAIRDDKRYSLGLSYNF